MFVTSSYALIRNVAVIVTTLSATRHYIGSLTHAVRYNMSGSLTYCRVPLPRGISGEKMYRISSSEHATLYFLLLPLQYSRLRKRMRVLLQLSGVSLLLLWPPLSVNSSYAGHPEYNKEEGYLFSSRESWLDNRNGDQMVKHWQTTSSEVHDDKSGLVLDFFHTMPRGGDATSYSPFRVDDFGTVGALHQQQASVPAPDGGDYADRLGPYQHQSTSTLAHDYAWGTDSQNLRLSNEQMGRGVRRSSRDRQQRDSRRERSRTTQRKRRKKNETIQDSRREHPATKRGKTTGEAADCSGSNGTSRCKRQMGEDSRNLLDSLLPLRRRASHHDIGLKQLQSALVNEMKVYDARKAYALALLFSYLGFPSLSIALSLAEFGRSILQANRRIPHVGRWQHYSIAHTLSAGESLVSTYLGKGGNKGAKSRGEEERKYSSEKEQQREKSEKEEKREAEMSSTLTNDMYGWF